MAFVPGKCLLRKHLRRSKLTQVELAEKLELSPQMISDFVNDRRKMNLVIAYNIAQIVGCQIEDLYEWKSVPPSKIRSRR